MGTADELALDILLNALSTFSREQLGIRQVVVGGQNEDWPVPKASPPPPRGWPRPVTTGVLCGCMPTKKALAGRTEGRAALPWYLPVEAAVLPIDRAAQPLADCLYTVLPLVLACQPALPATLDCPNPSRRPPEAHANVSAERPLPVPGARSHMPCLKPHRARPVLLPAA